MASVWNVTADEVCALARMSHDANTQPSTSDIEGWITESGLYLDGIIGGMGVDDITQATYPEAYQIGRRWLRHDVAAIALRARSRGGDGTMTERLQERADRELERLEARIARLGDAQPKGDDAANLTRTPLQGTSDATTGTANSALLDPKTNVNGRL